MAQQTVVGIFDTASEAQSAVESLVSSGFDRTAVDLSTRNNDYSHDADEDHDTDNGGGIGGFFSSLFGLDDDDDRKQRYTTVGQRGSIVTVHAQSEDMAERAADILDAAGAVDIDEKSTQYSGTQGYTGSTTGQYAADLTTGTDVVRDGETISVPIIEENLEVGKRTVETGGVRVRSRIIERPVEESVRLRSERVVVQRNPVNRTATDADFTTFNEGNIELTEHAEQAVVAKEARVVEEVSVGKTVDERDEVIHDTVRRTDVEVDNLGTTTDTYKTTGTNTQSGTSDSRTL